MGKNVARPARLTAVAHPSCQPPTCHIRDSQSTPLALTYPISRQIKILITRYLKNTNSSTIYS